MTEFNTGDGPDGAAARARLADAERVQDAVRRRAKWYARYLTIFGLATIPVVTAAGFVDGPVSSTVFTLVWSAFVVGISVWGHRFGANRRGFARTHFTWLAIWLALYAVVLFGGLAWFPHQLAWYLPGGVATSLPCFVTAYLEARR